MLKNKTETAWQPSATLATLKKRATIIKTIRDFFHTRGVLEVETPLMCHTSVTDPVIHSIPALFQGQPNALEKRHYLQTSPEYAMKRLLAFGCGAIFQISKAFRQGEIGRYHNPEFTMLEWYRPGFDHHQLMNEMDALLQLILNTAPATRFSYAALFHKYFNINPHTITRDALADLAKQQAIEVATSDDIDKDTWLHLLLTHCIEPNLGIDKPFFLYDFPVSQAALAKIIPSNPPVAARFEVYFHGIELANGFYELQDANEQRTRFATNLAARASQQLPMLPIDELFLNALQHGLPDCAGVALGIDRLIMLATQVTHIRDVLSFDFERA